ncbi:Flp pilus assembly protein TadD, contains TPR repeats [Hymenobacter actinosclerus]|uniref:Flp pilus assembly protein TadD, contains TPR repeats n=2 Tax=Hymenobacter actinosclerus TaxID=82805 RepID=A0A1I0ER11_9BACT|nr:Flp pilus assembly protein TadD, contains TPR repeats [Hymenobacter actinosclerus]
MFSFLRQTAVALVALLAAGPLVAQTTSLPQLAAEKLCACVGEAPQPDSATARLQRCLPQALTDAAIQQGSLQAIGTVEGMQSALLKTRELATASCPPLRNAYVAQRTGQFYAPSNVAAAQQAYDTGTGLLEQQKYKEALPLFLQAIKLDRQFVKAHDHAAICYRKLQDFKKAATYYEKSLVIFPEGDLALLNMAVVQNLLEKPNAARTYFEKLRFFHPYNPEGYFGIGKMALVAGEFPAALDNLFRAHRLYTEQESPYVADSNKLIGLLYNSMKEKDQLALFRSKAQEYHFDIQE